MSWLGFDNRMFLEPEELLTYKRRPPVRYAARNVKPHSGFCDICGEAFTESNPLQVAHKIPFTKGVLDYGLTPDWLDSEFNLVWAHRSKCNKLAELSDLEIQYFLMDVLGLV